MSKSTLRNNDGNPFLYLEGATGSTAFGVNTADSDRVNFITSDSVQNLDPASGSASISVQSTTPGDIEFTPHGSGQSSFLKGNVAIEANGGTAGNLLMPNTSVGGSAGAIEFGGATYVQFYGGNTFLGGAGNTNIGNTGVQNVGIGINAMNSITSGQTNIAIGGFAAVNLTSGVSDIAIGHSALFNATTSNNNVAIGEHALFASATDDDNTAIGYYSSSSLNGGTQNVSMGSGSLQMSTADSGVVAVGYNALNALNGGIQNTAVGYEALANATAANQNTAVGYQALTALTAPGVGGGLNAAYGNASLRASTLGRYNTAIGCQALVNHNGDGTNDIFNLAVGCQAGSSMTSGKENTLVGSLVANSLVNGDYNVIVGELAASNFTTNESSNIIIGGRTGTVGDNNTIRIGSQGAGAHQQNKCFIAGINGTSVTPAGTVVIDASGQLGTVPDTPSVWNEITAASATMVVNDGYIANRATLVTLALPAVAAQGSRFEIVGKGVGGWIISQGAGQQIHFGVLNSTLGAGGSIASTLQYDCVELICITANTSFIVKSSVGNITVV